MCVKALSGTWLPFLNTFEDAFTPLNAAVEAAPELTFAAPPVFTPVEMP